MYVDKLKTLKLKEIESILNKKATKNVQIRAAVTIQRYFRGYICSKRFRFLVSMRLNAAKVIQKLWRKIADWRRIKKQQAVDQLRATVCIQKFVKARQKRHREIETVGVAKMEQTYEYFKNIQNHLEESAQIKIRYPLPLDTNFI